MPRSFEEPFLPAQSLLPALALELAPDLKLHPGGGGLMPSHETPKQSMKATMSVNMRYIDFLNFIKYLLYLVYDNSKR